MTTEPKHRLIFRALSEEIGSGNYAKSGKLPSEAQLVERFHASRPTVVRVLRDLQTEGLVVRRAGSGTYLSTATTKHQPARAANEFGLLIPVVRRNVEIFDIIAGELAQMARAAGCMFWFNGNSAALLDDDAAIRNAEEVCQQFIARKIAGVFFAPVEHTPRRNASNAQLVTRLHDAGVAVVLLDRDLGPFPERSDLDLIEIDNFWGGYVLAEHLIKLGCKRIGFVAFPISAPTVNARIAGVREAVLTRGMDWTPRSIQIGNPDDPKFAKQVTAGRLFDAVVCGNDYTAALLIRSLRQMNVQVPRDLRVVGFDDVHYATLVSPALTTIHQPCREIAAIAIETMIKRIAEPASPARTIKLTPRLVVRESCGAYLPKLK